ncbi:MAG: toll/interleukin-1 receptor domain-containing protein [Pseudomonadota bacterium]
MAYDIFISYRRTDQMVARALVEQLEARGVAVWWDQKIEGGEDWRDAIVAGLESAQALVILFSDECNDSKQLKKEMAIADTLDKLVIPVLIEDTKPKGHFLYELAARNWIQVFPDPASRASDLADRLARELDHITPPPASSSPVAETVAAEPSAPAAPAPPPVSTQGPISQAEDGSKKAAQVRKKVDAKQAREEKRKTMRDFMPFRFLDLIGLIPLGAFMYLIVTEEWYTGNFAENVGVALMTLGLALALYGALVFPFRYYLRQRRVWRIIQMQVLNVLVPFALLMLGLFSWWEGDLGATVDEGFSFVIIAALVATIVVSAFGGIFIAAVAGGRRAMNAFNKNVEVL